MIREKIPYEITTFRTDGPYFDARHPSKVQFGVTLAKDLARRDFTINAMAYAPETGLVDLYGGQADLDAKRLRCVGNPQLRFSEDALRILRAVRFAATLGFEIEHKTKFAALQAAKNLAQIAPERICAELKKLLMGQDAGKVMQEYAAIFKVIFPMDFPEIVWTTVTDAITATPPNLTVRLALLDSVVGIRNLKAMRFDGKRIEAVEIIARNLRTFFDARPYAARKALSDYGTERLLQLLQAQKALAIAKKDKTVERSVDAFTALVQAQIAANVPVTLAQLCVNGTDAQAIGLQGRAIGRALAAALEAVLQDETCNTRSRLLPLLAAFAVLEKQSEK